MFIEIFGYSFIVSVIPFGLFFCVILGYICFTEREVKREVLLVGLLFSILFFVFSFNLAISEKNADLQKTINEITSFQTLYDNSLNDMRLSGLERLELIKLANGSNSDVINLQNLIEYKRNTIIMDDKIINQIKELETIE